MDPSILSGRQLFVSFSGLDTTAPPDTNPFAGRNYDGILVIDGTCAGASACSGGQFLCSGTCVTLATDPNNCGACRTVCGSGATCQSGTCALPPPTCTTDAECGTGMFCDAGTCTVQGAEWYPCAANNQCQYGLMCQPFAFACGSDADCGGGAGTCVGGFCQLCQPPACTSDSACGSNFYCDTPVGGCLPKSGAGTACNSSDQCSSGVCSGSWQFAERFVGQALATVGNFDVLSGMPSSPLALQTGLPGHNIDVISDVFGDIMVSGLGPVAYAPALLLPTPNYNGVGEGAVAALFSTAYSAVAFDVFGVNGGGFITVAFFRWDGTFIDQITLPTGTYSPSETTLRFAFALVSGSRQIVGISIANTDPGGLAYGNFNFGFLENKPVPALSSGTLALLSAVLLGVGMLGLGLATRQRGG